MKTLPDIMEAGKKFVDWLDSMPSVLTSSVSFLLGLILPIKFVILVVAVLLIYGGIQFYSKSP